MQETLLGDIDYFINERINSVYMKDMKDSPDCQAVSDKEDRLIKELETLLTKAPHGAELLEELQDTISKEVGVYAKYGYIQGCKDGIQFKTLFG